MELKWLEDYLALVKYGSFSKAADARFVTQPAFSRRIRSLENWLGTSLIDRTKYPTAFTEAGLAFIEQAQAMKDQIYASRNSILALADDQAAIVVMSQHSLAVSFLPEWLRTIEVVTANALVKIRAGNLHDALESFLSGTGDLLLCFSSPDIFLELERADIESIQVGSDRLIPVTAVGADGRPRYSSTQTDGLRLLSYPTDSFFGRLITRECMPHLEPRTGISRVCENALAEGLKALVEKGYGVAWLPESLVSKELETGTMARLSDPFVSIELKIKVHRFKGKHSELASKLWEHIAGRHPLLPEA